MDTSCFSEISVAILSCNRRDDLRETLNRLLARGSIWKEIVVADNCSSDGTQAMLRTEFPQIRLLALEENRGVAGLNQALAACSGSWVLSLDDDSSPDLDTWQPLACSLGEGVSFDAVTCSVRRSVSEIGSHTVESGIRPYLGLHQAGSVYSKAFLERLGGYDASLFLWGVELDLSARAIANGFRLGKSDTAIVEHRCTPTNRSSSRHAFYYTRNLLVFLRRYAPAETKQRLLSDYLANVILYSVLHRTLVYWKGARAGQRFATGRRSPLRLSEFEAMGPDLRLPFSFLG